MTTMDMTTEPEPCQVCGNDASEYPCALGPFCDDCWAVEYDYES